MGYIVLAYLDDLIIFPSAYGTTATQKACSKATKRVEELLKELQLCCHRLEGDWDGSQVI